MIKIIVILGGGINEKGELRPPSERRVNVATELYWINFKKNLRTILIPSSRYSMKLDYFPEKTIAESMRDEFIESGIPSEDIEIENKSRCTIGNVVLTLDLLKAKYNDIKEFTVVTSPFQHERAKYLFMKTCGSNYTINFVLADDALSPADLEKQIRLEKRQLKAHQEDLDEIPNGNFESVSNWLYTWHPSYSTHPRYTMEKYLNRLLGDNERSPFHENTKQNDKQSSANSLEEVKEGVTQTGLIINYWKNEARKTHFWNQHHGKANRLKPLFKDAYMKLFITENTPKVAKEMLDPKLALALAVRHKYFNKALSIQLDTVHSRGTTVESKNLSTQQIVILGSGYDTTPVRKKKYNVTFFEIDKKEVLDNKKAIYEKHQINQNAVYIGIDYLQQDFVECLKKSGLTLDLPTHFKWEGNTMYLSEESVTYVLTQIKENFTGKVLISFDYISKDVINQMASVQEENNMLDQFKKSKAPMINGYNDIRKEVADKLNLTVIENKVCAELTKEYGVGDQPYTSQDHYSFCTLKI